MTDDSLVSRRAAFVGLGALVAFWLLVLIAGWRQPGYSPSRDFVSALASEGARAPEIGVLALVSFGVAYLAAAVVLQRWVGTRFGAVLLVLAGLLTWVVAFARIHCPVGAAYCGLTHTYASFSYTPLAATNGVVDNGSRFGPHLHGWAVAASYALVAVAMLWLAILWWRRGGRRGRALCSLAALVTSLATVPFWVGSDSPGLAQRVWLGILTAWVVLICVRPLVDVRDVEEEQ